MRIGTHPHKLLIRKMKEERGRKSEEGRVSRGERAERSERVMGIERLSVEDEMCSSDVYKIKKTNKK